MRAILTGLIAAESLNEMKAHGHSREAFSDCRSEG